VRGQITRVSRDMQNPFNPVQILLSLHAQGRFVEMEQRARELLRGNGNVPILNELLGISLSGQKKFGEALPFLQKAVRREPNDALFWENLALCQRELGEYAFAERSLRQSLRLRPANAEALNTLGSVLRTQERTDEARAAFEQALAVAPKHGAACFNLGKLLLAQKRWQEAEAALDQAVRCGLESATADQFLGRILLMREHYEAAARHFRRAIARSPDDYLSFFCLARAESVLGRKGEVLPLVNAGFESIGDVGSRVNADTIVDFDFIVGLLTAMDMYDHALRILNVTVPFDGHCGRAILAAAAARNICDWSLADRFERLFIGRFEERTDPVNPFAGLSFVSITPSKQLSIARRWSFACPSKPLIYNPSVPARAGQRIKIGYLSSDFHSHAVGIVLAGVIENHDRSRFEIVACDHTVAAAEDPYRKRFRQAFDVFESLHECGEENAAQRIADRHVDIAVDLNGWTRNSWSHILVARPAPLQLQWLGYPGTMGAPWIDYIVADRKVIRAGEERFYSEKVLALPDCYLPNDDSRSSPPASSRSECGLPENAFVFGCFNQSYKVTPEVFDVWMRLLKGKDNSVLWLRASNDVAIENLRREAEGRGVSSKRLVLAPPVSSSDHLARIPNMDLALDCFPYNSHATACDMLWAGVPMVGLSGDTFAARVSESILSAADLPELVTRSYEDYFHLASRLAAEPIELAALRERVRARKQSALFDTKGFTRSLERGFELVWERHLRGLPPDHIDVPPSR